MGSTRDWFPSLRSVDSHRGALSMVLLGHCRSGRCTGGNALYFVEGSLSLRSVPRISFNRIRVDWNSLYAYIGISKYLFRVT